MKLKEVSYMVRMTIPGHQYDYEQIAATAEVEEGESSEEAFKELRKTVLTQTTSYKTKERRDGVHKTNE